MQLQQLKYFVTVIEHKSFSKAAASMFISQPSLSQAVQALEAELGFTLLERSRTGSLPTEMGLQVYRDVKAVLEDIEAKRAAWQQIFSQKSALTGTLRVACVPAMFPVFSECVIKKIAQSFPNIKFRIIEARNNFLLDYLLEDEVDLVLGAYMRQKQAWLKDLAAEKNFELVALKDDAYKIAVSCRNPLSKKEQLSAEDARDLPLASYAEGDDVADLFFERYFNREHARGYNSFEKMIWAALDNVAVSILPELATAAALKLGFGPKNSLRFMEVEGFCVPFTHYLCFASKLAKMPEFKILREILEETFPKIPQVSLQYQNPPV